MFNPFFAGTPEELEKARADHQAACERHEAEQDLAGHLAARVLHSLDEEQCRALCSILKSIRAAGNYASAEAATASFYIGILTSRLHDEFGVCLACGRKHDEEIAKLAQGGAS